MLIEKIATPEIVEVSDLSKTARGDAGFGSTDAQCGSTEAGSDSEESGASAVHSEEDTFEEHTYSQGKMDGVPPRPGFSRTWRIGSLLL